MLMEKQKSFSHNGLSLEKWYLGSNSYRMTKAFKEFFDEEFAVSESEVKPALKIIGWNKSPDVDGLSIEFFQATETDFIKMPINNGKQNNGLQNTNSQSTISFCKKDNKDCSNYWIIAFSQE